MNRQLHILALKLLGVVTAVWLVGLIAIYAMAPAPIEGRVAVVFPPSMSEERAFAALTHAGVNPIGKGWFGWIWAADLGSGSATALEERGAWIVVREFPLVVLLGCAGAPTVPVD